MPTNWYSIPGVRQRVRWSESRRIYVFEDDRVVPEELLRRLLERQASNSTTSPREAGRSSAGGSAAVRTVTASLDALGIRQQPSTSNTNTASPRYLPAVGAGSAKPSTQQDQPASAPPASAPPARTTRQRQEYARRVASQESGAGARPRPTDVDTDEEGSSDSNADDSDQSENNEDEENEDRIYDVYTRSRAPSTHFVIGRVIERPLGPPPIETRTAVSAALYGGVSTGFRRFVIIQPPTAERQSYTALPLKTYNGQGVAAAGLHKWHHAVIYTRPVRPPAPDPAREERPQRLPNGGGMEAPMQAQPILVEPYYDPTRPLDPMSRLDFFDKTEIPCSDHVRLYGRVHQSSAGALQYQYDAVWARVRQYTGQVSGPSSSQASRPEAGSANGPGGPSRRAVDAPAGSASYEGRGRGDAITTLVSGRNAQTDDRSPGQVTSRSARHGSVSTAPPAGARRQNPGNSYGQNNIPFGERAAPSNSQQPMRTTTDGSTSAAPLSDQQESASYNGTTIVRHRGVATEDRTGVARSHSTMHTRPSAGTGNSQRTNPSSTTRSDSTTSQTGMQGAGRDRGRMSLREMRAMLNDLASRARNLGVEAPGEMSEAQMMTLGHDPSLRNRWLAQIRTYWDAQIANRQR